MKKEINFKNWLFLGLILEAAILGYSFLNFPEQGEVYRHAARYSGRLSLFIYLFAFYYFAFTYKHQTAVISGNLKNIVSIFCILHFIHFIFLSLNVYLNNVHLIPYKLAGGFMAYGMILIYPFIINKVKSKKIIHFIYFYYVGIVMALTYVARIKGDFEGAIPGPFHYVGLFSLLLSFIILSYIIFPKQKKAV